MPKSRVVRSESAAVEAAVQIGYPVVVKPLDGNHGRGVALELRTDDDVRRAFGPAYDESRNGDVVVETFVTGNDYRVLVIGGKLAAVAQRVPAGVIGDGKHTVRELVDIENADPRRGIGHEKVLTRIKLTAGAEELVAKQGYAMDEVPPEGARVMLAATGNMSTGGTSVDRTHEAHPDNIEIAETAARVVGLDVAGIDFIAADITEPVREHGGAIVEVNAAPGFRMHTNPTEGEPQYVAKPVIDLLFSPGSNARIPVIGVTGTNGKTTTVRMIGHILKLMGRRVGMTTTDGIVIDGRLIKKGDMSGPRSAQMVLQNPSVDTAVFEVARGGILREGLGYDRNDVAVVTNVTGDHLGLRGVDTIQQLAQVKSVLVDAVPRAGTAVLNADDRLVARMARQCRGSIVYFSMAQNADEEGYDRVDGHCGRGGAAMVVRQTDDGELIVLRHADRTMPLLYTHLMPATYGGRARMNVANALAAAAAAWAAGAHLHDIRQGLRTFSTSFFQAPGRLNQVPIDGYRVILDYCHNVDGMRRLAEFVDLMMARPERHRPAGPRDWRHRHPGRPARRRPPRIRTHRRACVRHGHRARGPQPPRTPTGRVGRAGPPGRGEGRGRTGWSRNDPHGRPQRAGRRGGGYARCPPGRSRDAMQRRRRGGLPAHHGRRQGAWRPGHRRSGRAGDGRGLAPALFYCFKSRICASQASLSARAVSSSWWGAA